MPMLWLAHLLSHTHTLALLACKGIGMHMQGLSMQTAGSDIDKALPMLLVLLYKDYQQMIMKIM